MVPEAVEGEGGGPCSPAGCSVDPAAGVVDGPPSSDNIGGAGPVGNGPANNGPTYLDLNKGLSKSLIFAAVVVRLQVVR